MSGTATVAVDIAVGDTLDVKCHANGQKFVLDRVTLHGVTDEQFQSIVDAIELYLMRQRQRRLKERDAIEAAEAGK